MIGYIKGKIIFIKGDVVTILTPSGVGYEVTIPKHHLPGNNSLKKEEIGFFIKTVVREDAIDLYGFATSEEKDLFTSLIQITKLGPRSAVNILSEISPDELIEAIFKENVSALTKVPGIGKKTAKRIILELKEKLEKSRDINISRLKPEKINNQIYLDALSALKNLGYREDEVDFFIKQEINNDPDLLVEEIIRNVLKKLAKNHEKNKR